MTSLQLRESSGDHLPERVLQLIWMHQRFDTRQCRTTDGKQLKILHPGFWNHGKGPDFRAAVLTLNGKHFQRCDIEIDTKASNWRSHRHDLNPAFNKVRLHVIWNGPVPKDHPIPTFILHDHIMDTREDLEMWANDCSSELWPNWIQGECSSPLASLEKDTLSLLVRQAALFRLKAKAKRIEEDARKHGFQHSLWMHLIAGLGYVKNQWPMHRIASLRREIKEGLSLSNYTQSLLTLQARLFGIANLLPETLPKSEIENQCYLRKLWDLWWRDRDKFECEILPQCIWQMQGIRPANHPLRRLATVAHWIMNPYFFDSIDRWLQTPMQIWTAQTKMMEILGDYSDEFWSLHWTLKGRSMRKASPLIGPERTTDLMVNVLLPWFLARSRQAGQQEQVTRIHRLYNQWPRSADNSLLKLVRKRLLKNNPCLWIKSAADQQGLLQILSDFCNHSNAMCESCPFPEVVKAISV